MISSPLHFPSQAIEACTFSGMSSVSCCNEFWSTSSEIVSEPHAAERKSASVSCLGGSGSVPLIRARKHWCIACDQQGSSRVSITTDTKYSGPLVYRKTVSWGSGIVECTPMLQSAFSMTAAPPAHPAIIQQWIKKWLSSRVVFLSLDLELATCLARKSRYS